MPSSVSMIADTYGAGMPGAAVDDGERRDHPLVAGAHVLELLAPQLPHAMRRSKNRAPHEVHALALR